MGVSQSGTAGPTSPLTDGARVVREDRRLPAKATLRDFANTRDLPRPVEDRRRLLPGPVHPQHQDETVGRRRQPVGLFPGSGRLMLDVEIHGAVWIGLELVALAQGV